MKHSWMWMGVTVGLAMLPAVGSDEVVVTKGRFLTQTSAAAPVVLGAGGFVFLAEAPGFGGPPIATGATLKPPTGAARSLAYDSANDLFRLTSTADSAAALGSTYGAGKYTVTLSTSLLGDLVVTPSLTADSFPAGPKVSNYAATQSIDPDSDLTLNLDAIAGALDGDELKVTVLDGADVLLEDSYPGTEAAPLIPSGTLLGGKSYELRLRFQHATRDEGAFPSTLAGFFSETRVTIRTKAGGGNTDTLPPSLMGTSPTNHQGNVFGSQPVVFGFSEPMDPARTAIVWGGVVKSSDFTYTWGEGNAALLCTYGGGLKPIPNGTVTWALNPVAGAAGNFRDAAGNELPAGQYSGDFTVGGGSGGGGCSGGNVLEVAGFGMMKQLNRIQTGPSTVNDDPQKGASLLAFSRISDSPGRAAIEFPPDPAPKPHKLKFFAPFPGTEFLEDSYPTQADLEAAYPPGTFDFQLRDKSAPTTVLNHSVLTLTSANYPPSPRFSGFAAAQAINAHADFTLGWDAFTGATTNTDALTLTITDKDGIVVLSLPDTCANKLLPITATSVVLPKDLLKEGETYTAELTFFRAQDMGKTMPGSAAKGMTAVARATTMTLKATGGALVAAPVIQSVKMNGAQVELVVQCTPGRVLKIESAPAPSGPYSTVSTATPASSPATVKVPAGSNQAYFRARSE